MDVGRQRHLADRLGRQPWTMTSRNPSSAAGRRPRRARHRRAAASTSPSAARLRPGRTMASHASRAEVGDEEDLDRSPAGSAQRRRARQHPGVVDDDHVAGADQLRQLGHDAVLRGPRRARGRPASGPVARLHRPLRDRCLGQVVVELVGAHLPRACRADLAEEASVARRPAQRSEAGGRWRQNRCSPAAGGVSPRCCHAAGVATRPRGVRMSRPCWMRNGS